MAERFEFLASEKEEIRELYTKLKDSIGSTLQRDDEAKIREHLKATVEDNLLKRDVFGLNPILFINKIHKIINTVFFQYTEPQKRSKA